MKKFIKWIGLLIFILLLIHIGLVLFLGGINYKGTFSSKYENKDGLQKIITQHFEIVVPKGWFHLFRGYGEEGEAIGTFLTKSGKIDYEYGIFSGPFPFGVHADSIFVFSVDSIIANRFLVYIWKNENNESGIYIPRQHEMESSFSIFSSRGCTNNLNEIIDGISQMKFKKFYNFEWFEMDSLKIENQ